MAAATAPCPLSMEVARMDVRAATAALGRLLTDGVELLEDAEVDAMDEGQLVSVVAVLNDAHALLLGMLRRGL